MHLILLMLACLATSAQAEWRGLGGSASRNGAVPSSVSANNNITLLQLDIGGKAENGQDRQASHPWTPLLTVSSPTEPWLEGNTMAIVAHDKTVQYIKQASGEPFRSYTVNASVTTHPATCGQLILVGDQAGFVHALHSKTRRCSGQPHCRPWRRAPAALTCWPATVMMPLSCSAPGT